MNEHDYLKQGLHVLFPQKTYSYEGILEQFFLQLVIINVYSCSNT